MKEVKIKDVSYKIGKISAMKQMLILKRLTSVLGAAQPLMNSSENPEKALAELGNVIAGLPDEALQFIAQTCLEVCEMKQSGGGWAPVAQNGQLMFQDLDLLTMLSLTVHALLANLKSFFQDLPRIAQAGELAAKK